MGIPPIAPYPMPTEAQLPPNRASWLLAPHRAALLVHDMQRYFVEPFAVGRSPVTELVEHIRTLRGLAAAAGCPVFYTCQPGAMTRRQRGLLHDIWGPGMGSAEHDRQVVAELAPADGDQVLTKWRYSAFHRSRLRRMLREQGRDQLVLCGVYAHVGVLATAVDAFSLDIQPFVVADAVADFTMAEHLRALSYAAGRCAVTLTTAHAASALRPVPSAPQPRQAP
jgi:isochorismate hydrolase